MRPYHIKQARELFKHAGPSAGGERPAVEIDGDGLQICFSDTYETLLISAPFNENGDLLAINVTTTVLKRWLREAGHVKSTIRRVGVGWPD